MFKTLLNTGLFGAYVLMVLVFGFFLWQTLFGSEEGGEANSESKAAYSQQQSGVGLSPATATQTKRTDEAVAEYTKWLAVFTMFLVLTTVGLYISGERNVQVANRSAIAAKNSADAAKLAAEQVANVERPSLFIIAKAESTVPRDGPYVPDPKVLYEAHNMGRVPAILRLVFAQCVLVEQLDPNPTWEPGRFREALRGIAAGTKDGDLPPCGLDQPISAEDWAAIKAGKKFVLFKGVFVYEGVLDATYVTSVGYKIDMFEGSAVAVGGGIYNNNASEPGRGSDSGTYMVRKLKFPTQPAQPPLPPAAHQQG